MILRAPTPAAPHRFFSVDGYLHPGYHRKRRGRGLGQTAGCPIGSLAADMDSWITSVIAFPSAEPPASLASDAAAFAAQQCAESGAGGPFGCPPMSGCDNQAGIVADAVARIQAAQSYQSVTQYGAGAPAPVVQTPQLRTAAITSGIQPAPIQPARASGANITAPAGSVLPPGAAAMGYTQPSAPAPPQQPTSTAPVTPADGGGITATVVQATGFSLSSIPWWVWGLSGVAVFFMVKK